MKSKKASPNKITAVPLANSKDQVNKFLSCITLSFILCHAVNFAMTDDNKKQQETREAAASDSKTTILAPSNTLSTFRQEEETKRKNRVRIGQEEQDRINQRTNTVDDPAIDYVTEEFGMIILHRNNSNRPDIEATNAITTDTDPVVTKKQCCIIS